MPDTKGRNATSMPDPTMSHVIIVPWIPAKSENATPVCYSVHRWAPHADHFVTHHAPRDMKTIAAIGNFSAYFRITTTADTTTDYFGDDNAKALLPPLHFSGAALIDIDASHEIIQSLGQALLQRNASGILISTAGDDEHHRFASHVENLLKSHHFFGPSTPARATSLHEPQPS